MVFKIGKNMILSKLGLFGGHTISGFTIIYTKRVLNKDTILIFAKHY